MTVRAAWGRFFDLPHMQYFVGFDRLTPFGTQIDVTNAHVRRSLGQHARRQPVPAHRARRHGLSAGRWVRHVPSGWQATVLGPVERQRAATARRIVDGFSELPQQSRQPSPGRRSAEPGDLQPGRDHRNNGRAAAAVAREPRGGPVLRRDLCRHAGRHLGVQRTDALRCSIAGRSGLFLSSNYTMSECISDVVNYEPADRRYQSDEAGRRGVRSRQLRRDAISGTSPTCR